MKWFVLGVIGVAVALAVYVRLAPTDPAQWHAMPGAVTNRDLDGGAMRVVGAGDGGLARMDEIIRAPPRTEVLAGSVAEVSAAGPVPVLEVAVGSAVDVPAEDAGVEPAEGFGAGAPRRVTAAQAWVRSTSRSHPASSTPAAASARRTVSILGSSCSTRNSTPSGR